MEPTLAQIKEYLMEKGISLSSPLPEAQSNIQFFGDTTNEIYFKYYLEHSVEIHEWLNKDYNIKDNEENFIRSR